MENKQQIMPVIKILKVNGEVTFDKSRYNSVSSAIQKLHAATDLRFTQKLFKEKGFVRVTRVA